jgi:hypothetical protein
MCFLVFLELSFGFAVPKNISWIVCGEDKFVVHNNKEN